MGIVMRVRYWFIRVCLVTAVCLFTLPSGISHAAVVGSKHDLASLGGSNFTFDTEQVCVFCHTPHGANNQVRAYTGYAWGTSAYYNTSGAIGTTGQIMLLWNQALSNAPQYKGGPSGYELYTSSTMSAPADSVRVYSLLCLSCHDGVGAMNVMMNPPQPGELNMVDANGYPEPVSGMDQIGDLFYFPGSENPNIGERDPAADTGVVNLSNDHPVGIDYSTGHDDVASGGLNDPGLADGTVLSTQLRLFYSPDTLALTSIECSTCHEPHNQGIPIDQPSGDGKYPFLAESIENSYLCLVCHKK
jgi:cytochrome c553